MVAGMGKFLCVMNGFLALAHFKAAGWGRRGSLLIQPASYSVVVPILLEI